MKKIFEKSRKGFTLVELLIVIIILGALSATVMLTAGNSVAAAKANTIIANMTTVKDAALMYYSANPTTAKADTFNTDSTLWSKYLGDFELGKKQGSAIFTVENGTTDKSTKKMVCSCRDSPCFCYYKQ